MQAVGRLGSYISRSVYTVSGPFHPFGGAVDIIVVLQPDGTYKSSPWYVRFGKFQGVLKTKEKLVRINVNGVEADFHMYLDHKGEAYFLKEVDIEEYGLSAFSPPSSSGEDKDTDRKYGNKPPIKSKSCNYDSNLSNLNGNSLLWKNSRVFGNRSIEDESGVVRTASMERAEMAADLLDLNWSTNLASSKHKKDNLSRFSTEEDLSKGVHENLLNGCIDDDETCVVERTEILDLSKEGDDLNSVTVIKSEIAKYDSQIKELDEKEIILLDVKEENATNSVKESIEWENGSLGCDSETVHIMTQLISDVKFEQERDVLIGQEIMNVHQCLENGHQITLAHEERTILEQDQTRKHGSSVGHSRISSDDSVIRDILSSEISNEELLLFGKVDDIDSSETKNDELIHEDNMEKEVTDGNIGSSHDKCCSSFLANPDIINDYTNETNQLEKRLRTISSDVNINEIGNVQAKELTRTARSLPSMSVLTNGFDQQLPFVQSVVEDIKIVNGDEISPANPSIGNPPRTLEGNRRKWSFSFKRSKNMKLSEPITVGNENSDTKKILKTTSDLEEIKDGTEVKPNKKKIRIGTPTSEQLASFNLKEGKNFVIFTFSTAMLGKQQVEARIFLWKWDTRVVISDVDGTITRSDLLGQVMPLVGMDWSHTGVAHLFSAIKDNGYQLLFLSARSISQAFLTRQFLFNIKQDGKALPEGPVVISPDGLFPSLFREVVRRAPHEFKIACLEDIKALFPADTNPFYAGFGNRDTDEFSYLKVGIPRTKIFIINPKGEIVCNRRIDTKSYSSLHDLVHGMFPTMMSSSEQEDFNSWNYWKLPPPIIDV